MNSDLQRYEVFALGAFLGYVWAANPAWAKRLAGRRWPWASRSFRVVEV